MPESPNSLPKPQNPLIKFMSEVARKSAVVLFTTCIVSIVSLATAFFFPNIYNPVLGMLSAVYSFSGLQFIILVIVMYLLVPICDNYLRKLIYPPIFSSRIYLNQVQSIDNGKFKIRLDSIGEKMRIELDTDAYSATFSILYPHDVLFKQDNLTEGNGLSFELADSLYHLSVNEIVKNDLPESTWAVFKIKKLR